MQRIIQLVFLLACQFLFGTTLPAMAGTLPPCVRAVSSENGNFLVISEAEDKPGTQQIEEWSFEVFPKENFLNPKDRLDSQSTYWTDWKRWSVLLKVDRSQLISCRFPLITDDGEFLVLLRAGPTFSGNSVLEIYRKRDHNGDPVREGPDRGVFIKSITLDEIWPPDKAAAETMFTDESPEWYSGGTFEFTSDRRQLIHKTRWGNTVRISLEDGSLENDESISPK
jgi:hypothetical protein